MTKREINKNMSELYLILGESIGHIECRQEELDYRDNPSEKDEQENETLSDILNLINELMEKIEEL